MFGVLGFFWVLFFHFVFFRIPGPTDLSGKDGARREACVESESKKGNNMPLSP